ncbi:MAG: protease SohB [Pseudohongiellaceae bacterium]
MEYLIEYGMFLAKAATVVIAIAMVIGVIAAASGRERKAGKKGRIRISTVNEHFEEMRDTLRHATLDKPELKRLAKEEKKAAKQEAKQAKQQAKQRAEEQTEQQSEQQTKQQDGPGEQGGSGEQGKQDEQGEQSEQGKRGEQTETGSLPHKRRVFVLNFKGDIAAEAVRSLREEVSAILTLATPDDEVVLRLESPGGMVHSYGLASSQLLRIKNKNIPLTICVDKVAASGGYMMACLADRLISAPFAIIGSIGVLVQLPNFHRVLQKNAVDFEVISAGEYKRTLSLFGEITSKGRDKVQQEVDEVHNIFKDWVSQHRPDVDIDNLATGETWLGVQAKDRSLVDEIRTSDECLLDACKDATVFEVEFEVKKSIQEKLAKAAQLCADKVFNVFLERSRPNDYQ